MGREVTITQAFEDGDEVVVTAEAERSVVQVRLPLAALEGASARGQRQAIRAALLARLEPPAPPPARVALLGRLDLDSDT